MASLVRSIRYHGYSTLIHYSFFSFDVVLYLGFEKWEDQIVLDESDKGNNAFLNNGAFIAPHRGACGNFASLGKIGDIILEDTTFRGKPRTAITVASWVNLPGTTRGSHSVFSTARVMRIGQVMGKHTFVPTYGWSPDQAFMTKPFHTILSSIADRIYHVSRVASIFPR